MELISVSVKILLIVSLIVWVPAAIFLLRNRVTYKIRVGLIDTDQDSYDELPSYGKMLFAPRHYLKWTTKTWLNYIKTTKGNS